MQQIKGLYKLGRPLTALSGGLAVLLGGYVANTGEWLKISIAVVATILTAAAANAWNDIQDIAIDRINQPKRPLPAGLVTLHNAYLFSFTLTAVALILAAFINLPAFIIGVVVSSLLYIYSWKLKSTVLIGNATIALVSATSAIFGGVAAGNARPSLWIFMIVGVAILGREVLKTLADYEGDLHERCRTVATVWGRKPTRTIFYILIAAMLVTMMLPHFLRVYRPIYAIIVALGVYPVIIYVAVRVTRTRTGPQLEKLSQLMKYDFLVWFFAVLLGAAA